MRRPSRSSRRPRRRTGPGASPSSERRSTRGGNRPTSGGTRPSRVRRRPRSRRGRGCTGSRRPRSRNPPPRAARTCAGRRPRSSSGRGSGRPSADRDRWGGRRLARASRSGPAARPRGWPGSRGRGASSPSPPSARARTGEGRGVIDQLAGPDFEGRVGAEGVAEQGPGQRCRPDLRAAGSRASAGRSTVKRARLGEPGDDLGDVDLRGRVQRDPDRDRPAVVDRPIRPRASRATPASSHHPTRLRRSGSRADSPGL